MRSSDGRAVTPSPDPLTEPFWAAARQGELRIQRCRACGRLAFPPTVNCPTCGHGELTWDAVRGTGSVHSACTYAISPGPGFDAPHVVVQVALDEQPDVVLTSSWPDPVAPAIGTSVVVSFEQVGAQTLPVFTAAAGS